MSVNHRAERVWRCFAIRAIVYHGPGKKDWEEVPDPEIAEDTDAIVRVDAVTICGTDLHILKSDVPSVTDGRILGHEAVGVGETGALKVVLSPSSTVHSSETAESISR